MTIITLTPLPDFKSTSKARKAKKANPRSVLLSHLMKALGGSTGDDLAEAFVSGDDSFAEKFEAIGNKLRKQSEALARK